MQKRRFIGGLFLAILLVILTIHSPRAQADFPIKHLVKGVLRVVCETNDGFYLGTGFAIGNKYPIRYFVTNWHLIVNNPHNIFFFYNEDIVPAKIVKAFPEVDLAILVVDNELADVVPMTIAPGKLVHISDKVYALGFPAIVDFVTDKAASKPEDITVTDGIISRTLEIAGVKCYQTNTAINQGNSGGPLINEYGEVVGINTLGLKGVQGIYYAVQSDELIPILNELGIGYFEAGPGRRGVNKILKPGTYTASGTGYSSSSNDSVELIFLFGLLVGLSMILVIVLLVILYKRRIVTTNQSAPFTSENNMIGSGNAVKNFTHTPMMIDRSGCFNGRAFQLIPGQRIIMGRDPKSSQIVFPQNYTEISRQHCTIEYHQQNNFFVLQDLGSKYGTFLHSGERLLSNRPYYLNPGQCFYLNRPENLFEVSVNN